MGQDVGVGSHCFSCPLPHSTGVSPGCQAWKGFWAECSPPGSEISCGQQGPDNLGVRGSSDGPEALCDTDAGTPVPGCGSMPGEFSPGPAPPKAMWEGTACTGLGGAFHA